MRPAKWRKVAFWIALFYFLYTWPTEGQEKDRNDPVRLWVYPRMNVCLRGPCYIHTIVFAEPNKDNRWASIAWASDEWESGAGFKQLEGESSSLVVIDRFIRVGPANYVFEACVYRITESKPKRFCDKKVILSPEEEVE